MSKVGKEVTEVIPNQQKEVYPADLKRKGLLHLRNEPESCPCLQFNVIFLHKKGDPSQAANWRPIFSAADNLQDHGRHPGTTPSTLGHHNTFTPLKKTSSPWRRVHCAQERLGPLGGLQEAGHQCLCCVARPQKCLWVRPTLCNMGHDVPPRGTHSYSSSI